MLLGVAETVSAVGGGAGEVEVVPSHVGAAVERDQVHPGRMLGGVGAGGETLERGSEVVALLGGAHFNVDSDGAGTDHEVLRGGPADKGSVSVGGSGISFVRCQHVSIKTKPGLVGNVSDIVGRVRCVFCGLQQVSKICLVNKVVVVVFRFESRHSASDIFGVVFGAGSGETADGH